MTSRTYGSHCRHAGPFRFLKVGAAEETSATNPVALENHHLDHLLVPTVSKPWFRSLYENVHDVFYPTKLPPLQLTSKPVAVNA